MLFRSAFRDHNTNDTHTQLYPVKLEGLGRVLLDHIPVDFALDGPKRRGGRKRKGTFLENLAKRPVISPGKRNIELPVKPDWPDHAFPWSVRSQQRAEFARKEEEERLQRIEQYLERDSDEDDENDDQSLGLPAIEEELPPKRRGRGKMVPLPSNPRSTMPAPDGKRERVLIPSDPADARAALLSKRSVRELAHRKKQEGQRTVCICNGAEDGEGELVQCDECQKWFHLECVGIHDMSELGREEDPWYCNDCLGVDSHHASSSPTFVPTEDRMTANPKTGDAFFPVTVQDSPPGITAWNTPVRPPRTPPRGSDLTHTFSSRSSMGGSSQFGPHTPANSAHSVRVYDDPPPVPFSETLDEPFDPSATPSRGMKFSGPFTTPKAPVLWGYHTANLHTPSQPHRRGSTQHALESRGGASPLRTVYSNDESPVRRSTTVSAPARVPDSPLTIRQSGFPVAISLSATTQGFPPGHQF